MLTMLALSVTPANACGGFFCNSTTPVVQEAERIVFAVDDVAGVVETHVQVEYEGEADEFAWIVPVQSAPELFISSDMLFNMVATQLQPQHWLDREEEGRCKWPFQLPPPPGFGGMNSEASFEDGDFDSPSGVDVVSQVAVGPYDTVTLQASDIDGLMTWLADNDYAIPSTASDALAPYVHEGGTFVALKLRKGSDSGDLEPLGMRYTGTKPAVPIQLTSVAAADDLRLEVSVFSNKRAVPESYLHVELNDAAIDWFTNGSNRLDVITRAADEAGGHAFATDYAGTTDLLQIPFVAPTNIDSLRMATSPTAFIDDMQRLGFVGTPDVFNLFQALFPVQPGLDPVNVYNCPTCFDGWYAGGPFDADAATDAVIQRIIEPREQVEAMIQQFPYVTRMTSSLSASEMTIDPVFTFTDRMDDVELVRTATLVYECTGGKYRRRAPRRLELPSGVVIELPSERDLERDGLTDSEYLSQLDTVYATRIEQTDETGATVIADFVPDVGDHVDAFHDAMKRGCSTSTAAPGLFAGLLLMLGLRRR